MTKQTQLPQLSLQYCQIQLDIHTDLPQWPPHNLKEDTKFTSAILAMSPNSAWHSPDPSVCPQLMAAYGVLASKLICHCRALTTAYGYSPLHTLQSATSTDIALRYRLPPISIRSHPDYNPPPNSTLERPILNPPISNPQLRSP